MARGAIPDLLRAASRGALTLWRRSLHSPLNVSLEGGIGKILSETLLTLHTQRREFLYLSIRPLTSLSSARQSMLMGMEVVLALKFFFNLSHSLSSRRVGRGLFRVVNL